MSFDFRQRTATQIEGHPLDKLLASLRMQSAFYTHSHLTCPWGVNIPAMPNCMMYHIVLDGKAEFRVNDSVFTLEAGDFVLLPKGDGHILNDGNCRVNTPLHQLPIQNITERYETLRFGGSGTASQIVCGVMLFQHPLAIKLLGILPAFIKISQDSSESAAQVSQITQLLRSEAQSISVGAEAVLSRLADILVITAMREYLSSLDDTNMIWLTALKDSRIEQALKLIHDKPDKHWSLDELAQSVGMSRTGFATQFKALIGNTPMDYLTQWRMSIAYSNLQLTEQTVLTIGLEIGYQSEAAFSRAFKKVIGKSPTEVRKAYQLENG